jgi:pyruvate ferredoxin oxidoreductase alpha subunit
MSTILALDGNASAAEAMRQINPDVVAAYPITPSTKIPETFSQFVNDGRVDTEFVAVESEHSAMSACVGAAAAGGRVMTATAANGLALMWEMLYIASGMRLPVVMEIVNRALSGPINIHCDHSDSMGARDSGWIQLYSESAQEAYDNTIQAVRIAEHSDVLLPVMVCQDGFITSHSVARVEIYDDDDVQDFIGTYTPKHSLLDIDNPVTFGALDFYDYYYEHKRQQVEAMQHVEAVIEAVGKEFGEKFGRPYGLFDTYKMEDAEAALIVLSSTAGTAKSAIDAVRADGGKIGLIKPRVFRPFPADRLVKALEGVKAVGVMDRAISFGGLDNGGPLWIEVAAAAMTRGLQVPLNDYVFGIGGRDITQGEIAEICWDILANADAGEVMGEMVKYIGVRGDSPELHRPNGKVKEMV